jgi:hypothetical protein
MDFLTNHMFRHIYKVAYQCLWQKKDNDKIHTLEHKHVKIGQKQSSNAKKLELSTVDVKK